MSEQALDLRRSGQMVRRHKALIGVVAVLGLLAGATLALLNRPAFTSTALIVLPGAPQTVQATTGPGTSTFMETQTVVAGSDPVLQGALGNITPSVSLQMLRREVQASAQSSNILAVSAEGATAAQAERIANAVARSYISYVTSPHSLLGQVSANMLQPASSATGTSRVEKLIIYGLIGAVAGVLIGVIVALAISRGERKLRERDEIANCIGVPVLASFPVARPTNPTGWTELLAGYDPGAVNALHLRQALQQLRIVGLSPDNGSERGGSSLAILSLSSDPGAVAIGPQLAVFAASLGIPTTLLIGPQQDATVTAALRIASSVPPPSSSKRSRYLRVAVADGPDVGWPGAALTVLVAVVDAHRPQVADIMPTTSTVLGVSAGGATGEQLARAAASAAAEGREIIGVFVANPEPTDRTTGRLPQLARPA
jgi:capsular polysaccharide biosynthesis protein